MKELKDEWEMESKISSKKINLTFMDNNYSINFSSPYQVSFLYNQTKSIPDDHGESED